MPTPPGLDGGTLENHMKIEEVAIAVLCCVIFAGWGILLALGV
jgi:hypothetical protein